MTRDIEFRGRTENGWAYAGFLDILESQTHHPIQYFRVIPDTVGEWTGLYDKNGVKIFEDDIVRTQPLYDKPYSAKRKGKSFIGLVSRDTTKIHGKAVDSKWDVRITMTLEEQEKYRHYSWSLFYDCEVIGNIHENPELLLKSDKKE